MLCKAYAKFLNKTKREAYGDRFPPALPLGKYNFPKNNLVNGGDFIGFLQEEEITKELELDFCEKYEDESLAFIVRDVSQGSLIASEVIYDEFEGGQGIPGDDYCGFILMLGIFFHNKICVYKKIHKLLTLKKQAYAKKFGVAFIEDMLLLFSASYKKAPQQKIELSLTDLKKARISSNKIQKTWLKIGNIDTFACSWSDIDGCFDDCLGFYLDKDNKLILDVAYNSTNRKKISDFEDKEFDKFILGIMKEWVNQYLSAIAFTTCIYDEIKTKMLLENI